MKEKPAAHTAVTGDVNCDYMSPVHQAPKKAQLDIIFSPNLHGDIPFSCFTSFLIFLLRTGDFTSLQATVTQMNSNELSFGCHFEFIIVIYKLMCL